MTALLWAAAKGHAEVVMLLLVGGADVKAKDNQVSNIICVSLSLFACLFICQYIYLCVFVCVYIL